MNTNFFDVNELCRRLREAYPVAWTVLATLGNIIRSAARAYFPILVCMIVTNYLLGEILELAHIEMTRFILLIFSAVLMAVMIFTDRRAEYDVHYRRDGAERPTVGHDIAVMFSSIQYWTTMVVSTMTMASFSTFFAPEFAKLMPYDPPGTQALYALVLPSLAMALFVTVCFFVCMRIWYVLVPADEEVEEPSFAAPWRILANLFAWLIAILLLPMALTILVSIGYAVVRLAILYWKHALIILGVGTVVFGGGAVFRAWRIRSRCVRQLKKTMDEAKIRYRFEAHPIRSAFFGAEPISLLIFIGDHVLAVRMVSYLKKYGTMILTPDGNLGTLHTIAMRAPLRPVSMIMASEISATPYEPTSQAMTQWITKKETAFECKEYPDAERIYLISPTPKFWVTGDLKKTAPLDNSSLAYGYRVWTTSAFCRHIRLRAENNIHAFEK